MKGVFPAPTRQVTRQRWQAIGLAALIAVLFTIWSGPGTATPAGASPPPAQGGAFGVAGAPAHPLIAANRADLRHLVKRSGWWAPAAPLAAGYPHAYRLPEPPAGTVAGGAPAGSRSTAPGQAYRGRAPPTA